MTTRKTRFDGKTIIKKYNEYKDYLDSDSEMFKFPVLGIAIFVGFGIMLPGVGICSLLESGDAFSLSNIGPILALHLISLLALIPSIIVLSKAFLWRKRFNKMEEERRR